MLLAHYCMSSVFHLHSTNIKCISIFLAGKWAYWKYINFLAVCWTLKSAVYWKARRMLRSLCRCTLQQAVTVKCTGLLVMQTVPFCFQPARQPSILLINLQLHVWSLFSFLPFVAWCKQPGVNPTQDRKRQWPRKLKKEQRPIHNVITEKTRKRSLLAQSQIKVFFLSTAALFPFLVFSSISEMDIGGWLRSQEWRVVCCWHNSLLAAKLHVFIHHWCSLGAHSPKAHDIPGTFLLAAMPVRSNSNHLAVFHRYSFNFKLTCN